MANPSLGDDEEAKDQAEIIQEFREVCTSNTEGDGKTNSRPTEQVDEGNQNGNQNEPIGQGVGANQ